MTNQEVRVARATKETQIEATLAASGAGGIEIDIALPFFGHLLRAFAFHGGFALSLKAVGDIDVDPHHLVEDCGLVLGQTFARLNETIGNIRRFGHAVIPMDDALSEATVDACGRPYLVYTADYPQAHSGAFDMALIREFLIGLSNAAKINLHAHCRYGENSHHMAESLFKAMGKALGQAYTPSETETPLSTKGSLG